MMPRLIAIFLFGFATVASPAAADPRASFPFAGHYRVGRYMPVYIAGSDGSAEHLTLRADGAVETRVLAGQSEALVPWLIADRLDHAKLLAGEDKELPLDVEFQPLAPDQVLVGLSDGSMDVARQAFAGAEIVPVMLDPANPLPKPIEAWTGLDAVVLSGGTAIERLPPGDVRTLLAAGVAIVIAGDADVPDALKHWPWRRIGNGAGWMLQVELRGPKSLISPAAYAPTYGWHPQWPAAMRWRIFWFGVIFALVMLMAATLLRPRAATALGLAICIACGAALMLWRQRLALYHEIGGSIYIETSPAAAVFQDDRWTYQTAGQAAVARFSADAGARPIFASEAHFRASGILLECGSDGAPLWFTHRLETGARMAFVQRQIGDTSMVASSAELASARAAQPITTPLLDLARRSYLYPDGSVVGQLESDRGCPDLVIQTRPSHDR